MDEFDTKQTPAERAEERAMYEREDHRRSAITLTMAAMQHGGLREDSASAFLREMYATVASLGAPPAGTAPQPIA